MVAGGTLDAADISFSPQTLPDPARPNNVLAPFWTDLTGVGAQGIFAASLTDGVSTWIVVEWRVNVFGTTSGRVFQSWIGVNGVEDISFTYDPANLPAAPPARIRTDGWRREHRRLRRSSDCRNPDHGPGGHEHAGGSRRDLHLHL